MSFDLTNKNIKDTYQNLLQKTGSNHQLYDLVGNPIENLTIQGTLYAQSYIVSESVVNTSSGSTIFGDSFDDIHIFTGSISASGNISASGTGHFSHLTVDRAFDSSDEEFFQIKKSGTTKFAVDEDGDIIKYGRIIGGDGNPNQFDGTVGGHTGFTSNYINFNANPMEIRTGGNVVLETTSTTAKFNYPLTVNNITASGNISASSTSTGSFGRIETSGDISASGTIYGKQIHWMHHAYLEDSDDGENFIPMAGTLIEAGTAQFYNKMIAPYDGEILKVLVNCENDPGNTFVAFYKNGTKRSQQQILDASIGTDTVIFDNINTAPGFSGADRTFSQGDVLSVSINPANAPGEVQVTTVWSYTVES